MHSDRAAHGSFGTAPAMPLGALLSPPVRHLPPAHTTTGSGTKPAGVSTESRHPSILLVDDDTGLLAALKSTLEVNGFEVAACDGPHAAERTFADMQRIDVLITDLQMPGCSGLALAERLSATRPSLPVMIVSGASLDRSEREDAERRGWCFLNKPFDVMQLLTALYGLLDTGGQARATGLRPPLACVPETPFSEESPESAQDSGLHHAGASGSAKGRVLLIGDDPMVLRSRSLLLERAGYNVQQMSSDVARQGIDLADFGLVLLCRSVAPGDAVRIAHSLHNANPQLPILRFATFGEGASSQFATTVTSVSSPAFLLTEVERLVSQQR